MNSNGNLAGLHDLVDSPSSRLHTLPSKFRIPAMPSGIHRRLKLWARRDGLQIRPLISGAEETPQECINIQWGLKGRILSTVIAKAGSPKQPTAQEPDSDDGIEIGGILGRVHLWDTSYLLFFMAPPDKARNYLLPTQEAVTFPDELPSLTPLGSAEDELRRLYLASMPGSERASTATSHSSGAATQHPHPSLQLSAHIDTPPSEQGIGEFWTLKDVYALPMQQKSAVELFSKLKIMRRKGQPTSNQSSPQAQPRSTDPTAPRPGSSNNSKVGPATAAFVNALNPQNWRLPLQVPSRPSLGSRRTQSHGGQSEASPGEKCGSNAVAEDIMSSVKATQTLEERRAKDETGETSQAKSTPGSRLNC